VVLFAGTLFFFVSLIDALLGDLSVAQLHRLVWSPEFVGCILFLVSCQIALAALWRRRRSGERRYLDWSVALVNQIGSILFMVAAIAAFVRPTSGDALAVGVANWSTLTGALCFAVAGGIQELERPGTPG
jgi:O-antigen/teichoic acid export membrane protein